MIVKILNNCIVPRIAVENWPYNNDALIANNSKMRMESINIQSSGCAISIE